MLFNSVQFALFLPVVFSLYWLLRRSVRWQNLFLVLASYVFYGWWDVRFLPLIAFSTTVAYTTALLMQHDSWRRPALWMSLLANLGVLAVFKYYDFFAAELATLLGLPHDPWLLHLVLPVGISFYTFQALGYTIDVYRRTMKPTHDVVAFFAYVSFFPQLVAGPIERASSLLPQMERSRQFDRGEAVKGLRLMLWGLFKKMVVADSCAVYVDRVFALPQSYGGATIAMAAVLFSVQIYGDFSGYSDVAIGCARLFGIRLRRNFAVPYFSRDVAEFWRRWHISLTGWFRDYVYIPLGGSRAGRWRTVVNTLVVFLLSGLWHGANWTFIVWGLYHALLFIPLIATGRNRRYIDGVAPERPLPTVRELCSMGITFVLATIGWVIFRSPSIPFVAKYAQQLFEAGAWLRPEGIVWVSVALMIVAEWVGRRDPDGLPRLPRRRMWRWALYVIIIFLIVAFMQTDEMPFLYFQF